ncbi:uncharacterized protein LOC117115487 [Anneissia japonica]|uniref:uncharacterized protein LOC117115487 n=1 Tax=Anneissia japonica TaxID=1529436 RepID=UPI0014256A8D|nr:uncharacterized protein LOC117115487 [Anneissia japonica]
MATESTQTRVLLWTAPRCMSTAFTRSVNTLDDSVVFHENFKAAYFYGPKGNQTNLFSFAPYHTYDYVKALLQQEMPGKRVLFAKDFAYVLQGKFEKIPDGYIHTFLIRNPTKVFMSLRNQYKIKSLFFGDEMQRYQPTLEVYFVDYTFLKYVTWWQGWYKNAFNSNGFGNSKRKTNYTQEVTMLPADIRKLVEISEPYYKLLYDKRITI